MSKIKVDGEFLNHGMLKDKSESAYDNHMVNAHGRPSTEHTSQRRKAALRFNATNVFGRMGQNPSINALTNANAIASQQQAMSNSMMTKPDMSQQIMTGSFDPITQQVGMGIFGDQNARNMAVMGSGIMKHDELGQQLKELESKKQELVEKFGPDSDPVMEQESRIMDKKRDIEAAKKAHNSPAQHKRTGAMAEHEHIRPGETKTEFRNRISGKPGETSKKLRQEYIEKADKKNK